MTQHPTRIPPLPRAEWTEEARDVFAFWGEPGARENGSAANLSMVLASHPKLATAYNTFGKHLLIASTVPLRPRELIVLRTAWHLQADYEWHYHVGYALKAGMTLAEIAAVKEGPDAANWNEADAATLRAVDEILHAHRISDPTWAVLGRYFDRHQLMDIVFTIGNYAMLSWAIASFGVQLEDSADKIGFDLKTATGAPPITGERPGESKDWAANNAAKARRV
ncbi:carboxymuconolactone decarboxylase family protein [Acidocella sp.]|uniref:carboxymuconolactone decarboxylase family protein n=1 Tax=Acidocella sp. TaxID=50710 RepID=UPI00262EA577|nr:carboxymuconolactone decarboxylase family protein [Acidocella sp.]